jgi:hypothetical protein
MWVMVSSQGRAIEVLSVADRFALMLLLGWWLDDWPDQFVAMCAMAKLTRTDLNRDFSFLTSPLCEFS